MTETLTRRLIPRNRPSNQDIHHQIQGDGGGDSDRDDDDEIHETSGILPLHYNTTSMSCLQRMTNSAPCIQRMARCSRQTFACGSRDKRKRSKTYCFRQSIYTLSSCCMLDRFMVKIRPSVASEPLSEEREPFVLASDTVDTDDETPDSNHQKHTEPSLSSATTSSRLFASSSIVDDSPAPSPTGSHEVQTHTAATKVELLSNEQKQLEDRSYEPFNQQFEANNAATFETKTSTSTPSPPETVSTSSTTPTKSSSRRPFLDFSRCRAELPSTNPLETSSQHDFSRRNRYEEDETSVADRDYFPPVPSRPNDHKIEFLLKVPKSHRSHQSSRQPTSLSSSSSNVSETLKATLSSTNNKARRPPPRTRSGRSSLLLRQNSSGSTDLVGTLNDIKDVKGSDFGNGGYSSSGFSPVKPPPPQSMKMQSSNIASRPSIDVKSMSPTMPFSGLNQPIDMGFVEDMVVPLKVDDSENNDLGYDRLIPLKGGSDGGNHPSDDDYRSVDSSVGDHGHNYRHAHSEDEIFHEEKEMAKKKAKQRRRSSFVAGSKISRYDDVEQSEQQRRQSRRGSKSRPPNGGRKPRRKSNDDAYW